MGYRVFWRVLSIVYGQGSVYDWLSSMCCGFLIVMLSEMAGVFAPFSFVNASRRVWSILGWSSVERSFSFATRYMFSLGFLLWSGAVGLGLNGIDVSFWV